MEPDKKALAQEWVQRAEDDERNAASILRHRDGTAAMVCFLSQQVAEKYLKALLVLHAGESPKIHNLTKLAALVEPHVQGISAALQEDIILLEPLYVETRYPADIPLESFTWETAEQAHAAALQIKAFAVEHMQKA